MNGVLNDRQITDKSSNIPELQELCTSIKRQMTLNPDSPGEVKMAKIEELDQPDEKKPLLMDSNDMDTPPPLIPAKEEYPQIAPVQEPKDEELDPAIINRIMLEVLKHISENRTTSEVTMEQLKDVERKFLEEIGEQAALVEKFNAQWLWHFACAFHMADRRRKHDLFRGILDYGAEKDQKNGLPEHSWIETFFEHLILQNDKDVLRAHRDAAEAVDRKQYHRLQAVLNRYFIELPAFDEPMGAEQVPIFDENELILPRWLANVFCELSWPQWLEIRDSPWGKIESIVKSVASDIGLDRTEYIYILCLTFLKIQMDSPMWEREIAWYQPEEEQRKRAEAAAARKQAGYPVSMAPDCPHWLKPLMHATMTFGLENTQKTLLLQFGAYFQRYLQWRRQYESMLHYSRRMNPPIQNVPPLNYSRIMGSLSFGRPIIAQPSMAMQKLYQHLWTEENHNFKYLKIMRQADVVDQVNMILHPVRGFHNPIQLVDDNPTPKTPEPNLTLDTCAYLSKILETALLPITDMPYQTPEKLPTLHLK